MVVVADRGNHRVALWHLSDGSVWKLLGSPDSEPRLFTHPKTVAVTAAGALAVTDERRVQVLTVDGAVVFVIDPAVVVCGCHLGPMLYGVTVYVETDEILITDRDNNRVLALTWSMVHFG